MVFAPCLYQMNQCCVLEDTSLSCYGNNELNDKAQLI